MIRNYFKTAWRNIHKNRQYTYLSMFGLALGLAVFVTVLIYTNRENSYDRWDDQLDRVYRIITQDQWGDELELTPFSPAALGADMQTRLPEVEYSTVFRETGEILVSIGDYEFYSQRVIMADSNFFRVFPYPFYAGHPEHALNQPDQAVLSRESAIKWFGTENPIGKTLEINQRTFTISGVFEKPAPSHLNFDVCVSAKIDHSNWNARVYTNYVLLKPHTDLRLLSQKARQAFVYNFALGQQKNPYQQKEGAKEASITNEQEAETWLEEFMSIRNIDLSLEPVADIHLRPKSIGWRDAPENHPVLDLSKDNEFTVWVFSLIGVLVLLLAAINYTNMAIAIGNIQTKDAGLRKIVGASRGHLRLLSLTSAFIQIAIALLGALLISFFLIRYLNKNFGLELEMWSNLYPVANVRLIVQLVGITLILTLLTGFYPTYLLSRFRPVQLIKGELKAGLKGSRIRNALVVVQFVLAMIFITSLVIIRSQLSFMKNNDPGFTTQQVLRINGDRIDLDFFANLEQHESLMNRLRALPEVENMATTHFYPGRGSHAVQPAKFGPEGDTLSVRANWVGPGYFEALDIQMAQGRSFSLDYATDTVNAAIINETAAGRMGLVNPVGEHIRTLGMDYHIVGVVRDNHLAGYQQAIDPEVYVIGTQPGMTSGRRQLLIRFRDGFAAQAALEKIDVIWKDIDSSGPMRYSWLKDDFGKLLNKYDRIDRLVSLLTMIAISIAIMGIFGISTFVSHQRTKEIGIRKVLGASVSGLVTMLSKDFLLLVCLAIVIASPIAWWAMNNWLADFAYRIDIQWWMFALAGISAVLIAFATVSWQAIRAAMVNPVDSLRDE